MSQLDTPTAPPTSEDAVSQIPALHLLRRLGWEALTPDQVVAAREGRKADVLLTTILRAKLEEINTYETPDGPKQFGTEGVAAAIQKLASPEDDGLVTTNERIWDLLRLGTGITMTVAGRRRDQPFRYIDWEHPERNAWHVTEEFEVGRRGSGGEAKTRRPDIVCFVNGIPFVVIECKRHVLPGSTSAVDQAVSQHLRNQHQDEIPRLYQYAQQLLALAVSEAKYSVTGTEAAHWSQWREREFDPGTLGQLRAPADEDEINGFRELLRSNPHRTNWAEAEEALQSLAEGNGDPTRQDQLLESLCTRERLLELVRSYTIFEKDDRTLRKVARYQQYECVKKCLKRVKRFRPDGRRDGGIVWHTQGSGKSLTMFLLANHLLQDHAADSPRVIVVTDRVDLDRQITGTFQRVGAEVVQAKSSSALDELLRSPRSRVITTTIHKFETYTKHDRAPIDDPNIFVLIDEGHRTQSGTLHASMRKALPKASLIGFTGTPILRGHKQSALAFGDMIDTYTIDEAVEDGAVVNLYYEGRYSDLHVDADPIDTWIEHHTRELSEEQVRQLKQRYSSMQTLNQTQELIKKRAADICLHFKSVFQAGETGLKGQLVTPTKVAALRYKEALDGLGVVSSEVLISAPDSREGNTTVAQEDRDAVQKYWDARVKEYGSEDKYVRETIRRFKKEPHPEIIIVVDMLLTGFDAPNNACLYLTRKLRDHTLLQAIARVNRVHPAKQHGLIVDYYGVVEELDHALGLYAPKGADFEGDDLAGVLADIRKAIEGLADTHKAVWNALAGVPNDLESHSGKFVDPELRRRFHGRVSAFGRCLQTALGSDEFWRANDKEHIRQYQKDLKYFLQLRRAIAIRYGESVDFGEFDAPIRALLDAHVDADAPEIIVDPIELLDAKASELEIFESGEAKAEAMANRLDRTINESMKEDPAFFSSLGERLQEVWAEYREKRLSGGQFLQRVDEMVGELRVRRNVAVRTVYQDVLVKACGDLLEGVPDEAVSQLASEIEAIIHFLAIVDWQQDLDIQNEMKGAIENGIFDWQDKHGVDLGFDVIDSVLDTCIETARNRPR